MVWNGPNALVQVSVPYTPEYASNAKPVVQATIDSPWYLDTLGGYPYKSAPR